MQGVSKVEALRITGTVFQNAIALDQAPGAVDIAVATQYPEMFAHGPVCGDFATPLAYRKAARTAPGAT